MSTGGCEDALNGRDVSWLFGHVADWSGRDWIVVAILVWLLPDFYKSLGRHNIATIVIIYILFGIAFAMLHMVSYEFGLTFKKFDPGIEKPYWIIWRSVQILPGALIGLLLLKLKKQAKN